MSMDDGGWDDAGFDGGMTPSDDERTSTTPASADGRPTRPGWHGRRALVAGATAGGVAVVVLVVLVVLLVTGGSTDKPAAHESSKPTASVSTLASPSSTRPATPTSSTAVRSQPPLNISLAAFDKSADQVCSKYATKLQKAYNRRDAKAVDTMSLDLYDGLQSLVTPTDDADQARQWINNIATTFDANSPARYVADAKATNALAKSLGMTSCAKALPVPK